MIYVTSLHANAQEHPLEQLLGSRPKACRSAQHRGNRPIQVLELVFDLGPTCRFDEP